MNKLELYVYALIKLLAALTVILTLGIIECPSWEMEYIRYTFNNKFRKYLLEHPEDPRGVEFK